MAAKDYRLCASALTGSVYIAKISKRNQNRIIDDKIVVPKGEFINAIVNWVHSQEKNKENILTITAGGEPILEIKQL